MNLDFSCSSVLAVLVGVFLKHVGEKGQGNSSDKERTDKQMNKMAKDVQTKCKS